MSNPVNLPGITGLFLALLLVLGPAKARAADEGNSRLTLQQAIEIALKQHPAIKESRERMFSAEFQIGVSKAAYYPQIIFDSNYFYGTAFARGARGATGVTSPGGITTSITPTSSPVSFYINRFSANLLLYDFGKTPGLVQESRSSFYGSREDYAGNRQKVVLDARSAYYAYLAARRAVKVEQENVAQNQTLLKQAQGFYNVGLRAKIDVTKAEANLYDAEASLIRAKNAADLTRVTLMTALGMKTWPYQDLEDMLEVTPIPRSLEELKTQAFRQRPELMKNKYQQDFNEAALKVAKAGYFPALTSTAAYGWQGTLPMSADWWVGAAVQFPLFEGLATTYSVKKANADIRATQANSEVLRQDVNKEVEQAYLDLQSGWELIRATKKAVESARENFRLAQGRYQVGVGSIIEVTDAQVQLSRTELRFVQALYDYRTTEARLDKAVGKAF